MHVVHLYKNTFDWMYFSLLEKASLGPGFVTGKEIAFESSLLHEMLKLKRNPNLQIILNIMTYRRCQS